MPISKLVCFWLGVVRCFLAIVALIIFVVKGPAAARDASLASFQLNLAAAERQRINQIVLALAEAEATVQLLDSCQLKTVRAKLQAELIDYRLPLEKHSELVEAANAAAKTAYEADKAADKANDRKNKLDCN